MFDFTVPRVAIAYIRTEAHIKGIIMIFLSVPLNITRFSFVFCKQRTPPHPLKRRLVLTSNSVLYHLNTTTCIILSTRFVNIIRVNNIYFSLPAIVMQIKIHRFKRIFTSVFFFSSLKSCGMEFTLTVFFFFFNIKTNRKKFRSEVSKLRNFT